MTVVVACVYSALAPGVMVIWPRGGARDGVWALTAAAPAAFGTLRSGRRDARHRVGHGAERKLPGLGLAPCLVLEKRDFTPASADASGSRRQ